MHTDTMDLDVPGANPAPRLPKDGPVTHAHDTADSNRYRPTPTKRCPSLPKKEPIVTNHTIRNEFSKY